jgi:hypothetical protein
MKLKVFFSVNCNAQLKVCTSYAFKREVLNRQLLLTVADFGRVAIIMSLAVFFKARLKIRKLFCDVAATQLYLVYSIVACKTRNFILCSVQ